MIVRAVVGIDQSETMSSGHSMIVNSPLLWLMVVSYSIMEREDIMDPQLYLGSY